MQALLIQKIDLSLVLQGHWQTLIDERSGRTSIGDIVTFYAVPVVVAGGMAWANVRLSDGAIDVTTNALAILAGLLFNLLVLLHALSWPKETHPLRRTARRFAQQIYANISYAIVVSLFALVPLVVAANFERWQVGRLIAGTIALVVVLHFGLTICMVLKRMYVMLQEDLSNRGKPESGRG